MATAQTTHAAPPPAQATHAEVGHEPGHGAFPPFKPDSFGSQLLWLAMAFGLLWMFMAKVGAPRIGGILANRRERIEGDLNAAQGLRDQASVAEAAYDKALSDARRGANKLAEETRQSLAAEFASKKDVEEQRLAQHLAVAEKRIGDVRDKALAEVGGIATDCAEAMIARLTGAPTREDIGTAVTDVMKGMERQP